MERKAILIRIDEQLWKELRSYAAESLRSLNGQIEFLLREAVRKRKGKEPAPASPEVDDEPT